MKILNKNTKGFTLIELLMTILIIAILATIGITQFTNFSKDAKDAAVKASVTVLRNGIAAQNGLMRIRCGWALATFPPVANVNANDISLAASPCTSTQAPSPDNLFVQGGIPPNAWDAGTAAQQKTVALCVGAACTDRSLACSGGGRTNTDHGWCYNDTTGNIWANSQANDGANAGTGTENSF